MIAFIPGPPVPFARPRFNKGRVFTQPEYDAWKTRAAWLLKSAAAGERFGREPVHLTVNVFRPRPQTRPDWVSRELWGAGHLLAGVSRSDLDNIVKAAADALQDAGVIEDDRWIVHITACSWFAGLADRVGVEVAVEATT